MTREIKILWIYNSILILAVTVLSITLISTRLELGVVQGRLLELTTIDDLVQYKTVAEINKEYGISKHKLYDWAKDGLVKSKKIKGVLVINSSIFDK
jgi:hypothetical protein